METKTCPRCNSTNINNVALIDTIDNHNIYNHVCDECDMRFIGDVEIANKEAITTILRKLNITDINNLEACNEGLNRLYELNDQYDVVGLYNTFCEEIDILEHYIETLEK